MGNSRPQLVLGLFAMLAIPARAEKIDDIEYKNFRLCWCCYQQIPILSLLRLSNSGAKINN